MADNPSTPPASGSGRWIRIALVISLAVNLLVLGVIGGAVFSGKRGDGRPAAQLNELGIGPYGRALTQEQRRDLRTTIRGNRAELRSTGRALRDSLRETLVLLRAETLDAAQLGALLEDQRTHSLALQDMGRQLILGAIDNMTVAERRAYADRLEQSIKRRRRPRRDRSGAGNGD